MDQLGSTILERVQRWWVQKINNRIMKSVFHALWNWRTGFLYGTHRWVCRSCMENDRAMERWNDPRFDSTTPYECWSILYTYCDVISSWSKTQSHKLSPSNSGTKRNAKRFMVASVGESSGWIRWWGMNGNRRFLLPYCVETIQRGISRITNNYKVLRFWTFWSTFSF